MSRSDQPPYSWDGIVADTEESIINIDHNLGWKKVRSLFVLGCFFIAFYYLNCPEINITGAFY